MSPEQITAIRTSWPHLAANADRLTASFYAHLFASDESAARLFAGVDMATQRTRLAQALAVVVHGIDDPDALLPSIAALGKRHAHYGVEARQFDSVGEALIAAIGDLVGDEFSADVRTAWTDAYALIASVMRRALVRANGASLETAAEIATRRL